MMNVLFYTLVLSFLCNAVSETIEKHPNWSLLPKDCGKAKETQFRIYGGQDAELGQFPWVVRIFVDQNGFKGFNCGGGLISSRHVVTAAHCADNSKILFVRVGEYNTATKIDCDEFDCAPQHQDVPILFFLPHPDWDADLIQNDIALIKLAGSVRFHNYVQPLCLPGRLPLFENYVPTGNVQLAGWGHTDSKTTSVRGTRHKKIPDILQFVNLNIKDLSFCAPYFPRMKLISGGQLCIGASNGRDTCDGDSGGPAMKEIKVMNEYRFFLLGVVSFGPSQCGKAPAIYTYVRYYLKWILDNL